MKLIKITLLALFVGFIGMAEAQIKTPAASPSVKIEQTVGLTTIHLDYSRPSVKGRTIFGDLVPYNKLWRTGANQSTDITFSDDVEFGGVSVPAGKYAIYTYPGKESWKVLLYSDTDIWGSPGDDFDASKVVAEVEAPVEALTNQVESFNIYFDRLRNNSADIIFAWDNTLVSVPIQVDTKSVVEASIEKTFSGPTANEYHAAANYYLEEGMDLEQAHQWSSKAVELNPEAFWMLKVKSEIEAKMGKYDQAIATAKLSKEVAEKAGSDQYVEYNEANIAKWKKMN